MPDTPSALGSALAATRAAGPTRFTMRLEHDGSRARLDGVRPRGPLRGLARFLGRRLLRTVEVEGVLDLEDRRVVASTGDVWGMIQIGDRVWTGRPGRRIDDRSAEPATLKLDPLALIESIDGLHDARDRESPEAGRHFVAPTDTGTVQVSLRGARVHRIRRDDDGDITTLDLHEAGVDTSALDWTRLPGGSPVSDD